MKILIAYDQDTIISKKLEKGLQRAKDSDGYVYLVRTCSSDTKEDELIEIEARLAELKRDIFDKENIPCETHLLIRGMAAGEDIVRYAREKQVDEIIIGIRKRSTLGKLIFGSTAQYIILEAHCPVLCVK